MPANDASEGNPLFEVIMTGGTGVDPDEAERLKELGHLAAAVGHHVINAFSAVVSNAELIRSHTKGPNSDTAELAALGSAIIENALSASHVPRRLIDWTRRFTSPGFDQAADPAVLIDLNEIVRETAVLHQGRDGAGLDWVLNLSSIPMIRGSASQIRSLFGYLIQNAREAMPKGRGTITVTSWVDSRNWVTIEIRDSGHGMTAEVLKRATEPFFTTKPGRSGIGLTVAHGIWRRHRGALSIESRVGEGTLIRLAVEAPAPASQPERYIQRVDNAAATKQPPAPSEPQGAAPSDPLASHSANQPSSVD
jgi:two-component system, NtrC family, sensor kinase